MKHLRLTLSTLILALGVGYATYTAAKAKSPERPQTQQQVSMALDFLHTLLNTSTVAKHIEARRFPPAMAYLEEARRLHQQATVALQDNDLVSAIAKRDEAIRLVFEAGHLAQMDAARHNKPKYDYEHRLRSIEALMTAYRNILTSKNSAGDATKLEQQISPILNSAESLSNSGDHVGGRTELDKAYNIVKLAIDKVRGGETLGKLSNYKATRSPRQAEYESKLRSINALLDAQQRIAHEKSSPEQRIALHQSVSVLLNSADDYVAVNDYDSALKTANRAYLIITDSIKQMRGGDTLVRSLNFESTEDEYRYELDRNNTYKMLFQMVLKEKQEIKITERIQQFIDQAESLRVLAERQALQGNYAEATASLEQSTRNLIFAMRNAGLFVPG